MPRASARAEGITENATMSDTLQGPAREEALAQLAGWREVAERDAIAKSFVFENLGRQT